MIRQDEAKSAADELLAAAILGDGWPEALQRLADAAEAGGATLMRLRGGRPLARFSSTGWVEADSAMLAGHAPRSPRLFFPDHVFGSGFLGDTDIWAEQDLHHDPYFQDFLRPRGVFYHAKARLFADGDERISISVKRFAKFGPYDPSDIAGVGPSAARIAYGGSHRACWMQKHQQWHASFTNAVTQCSSSIREVAC